MRKFIIALLMCVPLVSFATVEGKWTAEEFGTIAEASFAKKDAVCNEFAQNDKNITDTLTRMNTNGFAPSVKAVEAAIYLKCMRDFYNYELEQVIQTIPDMPNGH